MAFQSHWLNLFTTFILGGVIVATQFACQSYSHLAKVYPKTISVEGNGQVDPEIEIIIAPYRDSLQEEMSTQIGLAGETLTLAQPNSSLGNWLTDVVVLKAEQSFGIPVDFAIINYYGIRRKELLKGAITRGMIFELLPFDNQVVLLEMTGEQVAHFLSFTAAAGGWPVSDELRFVNREGKAEQITIEGKALLSPNQYIVAMPDYIANGGDGCFFLKGLKQYQSGLMLRNVIIDYLMSKKEKGQAIIANPEHRILQ